MNGVEIGEGADEGPKIVRGSKKSAREIEGRYLGDNGGEDGYDTGGRSVYPVVEFDTFEVGDGQASIGCCLENRRRDVSGVVAYDSFLVIRQETGCILGEFVEGLDLPRGMETDGAETVVASGRDPSPGDESTGVERLWVVVEMVDDLVDELGWDVGRHRWQGGGRLESPSWRLIRALYRSTFPKRQQRSTQRPTLQARETHRKENPTLVSIMAMFVLLLLSTLLYTAHVYANLYVCLPLHGNCASSPVSRFSTLPAGESVTATSHARYPGWMMAKPLCWTSSESATSLCTTEKG